MKKQLIGLAALALLALTPATSSATFLTLQDLLDGATITSGDKLFSNFQFVSNGTAVTASEIEIGDVEVGGNFGVQINIGTGATPFSVTGLGNTASIQITYDVSATAPGFLISGVSLTGDPTVTGGDGFANVVEGFGISEPTQLDIFAQSFGGNDLSGLSDSSLLGTPTSSLTVTTDYTVFAFGGTASLSTATQTFAQTETPVVPAPASFVLLLSAALVAWPAYRWRRSQS